MYFIFNSKVLLTLTILSFVLSIIANVFSPLEIPIHFNAWNKTDIIVDKYVGLFIFPVLMMITLIIKKFYLEAAYGIYLFAGLHIILLYNAINY